MKRDAIEAELLAMLQETSAERMLRQKIKADIIMEHHRRALDHLVNVGLAKLIQNIAKNET
jgi:hypothetical protein